ncbi:tryptophanyl-tRNA synthetase [Cenarchaeum symbiosum A]|uniref:Tryptophan--tRNA ligase n=1 Tax=Cenarchaeum symbiosum (strain A) TaxID=414004 RepID=A0RTQ8_CENSY|nr:tryptophanyl-tRNA synthetase [Cenarchaeum symbiosum A]
MPDNFVVTPWRVEGEIDYDRLTEQFGTTKLTDELLDRLRKIAGEDHFMLRRRIFFSHRDLNMILDSHESGKGFFLYTGRGPSGHTHIGHLIPWVFAKWLQDRFGANMYFQLTDDEKFYSQNNMTLDETRGFAYENALDFVALGFDPAKTSIVIDTEDISTLYPLAAQVAKKLNFSNMKAVFGFTNETNIGMIFYTSLQSAPCFLEDKPVLIPLGVDQDPHFRLTRDVAPKLGRPKPALLHNIMVPALGGPGGKMSGSSGGAIYTTDDPGTVKKKINKYAFSGGKADVEEHRKLGGDPEVDVSYQYLRIFFEPDDARLRKIHDEYRSGSLLTGELKGILIEKINTFLARHQEARERAKDRMGEFRLAKN